MCGSARRLLAVIVFITIAGPVCAWSPETRVQMIDEATRLMPASLKSALESRRDPLLRGMLAPLTDEDGPGHRAPWNAGSVNDQIVRSATRLRTALTERSSFTAIADRFGELAHYVADAGFPPGAGRSPSEKRYLHFAGFCDSRRERFPLVFYGHEDEGLSAGDFGRFADRVLDDARIDDQRLAYAYERAGDPPNPAAFDDRSVPFAVGSLAYSRTITDIVRVWLSVWKEAGGDMDRTPYWGLTSED